MDINEVKAPSALVTNEVVPIGVVFPDLVTNAEEHGKCRPEAAVLLRQLLLLLGRC
jgi:two-component sensor histidine kinase